MGREHYLVRALFVVPAPILTCVFYDAPGSLAVRVCVCVCFLRLLPRLLLLFRRLLLLLYDLLSVLPFNCYCVYCGYDCCWC